MICAFCGEPLDKRSLNTIYVNVLPNRFYPSDFEQNLFAHFDCFRRALWSGVPVVNPNEDG